MIRFFTFLLAVMTVSAVNAQTYIWGGPGDPNSEFAGGLNDWTTEGFSDGTANDLVVWYWDEDGNANAGAYASGADPIESPSVENGAAAFDSDFLDSGGIGVGQGDTPAPHLAYLTSPVIDLSGHETATVRFNQSMRKYQSITSLQVTIDGGLTWVEYVFNENIGTNEATSTDQVTLIDISDQAAGQSEVQIRFVFNGDYYYIVIDDVYIIESPENEIALGDFYYPMNASTMPEYALDTDTMEFYCDVVNTIGSPAAGTATVVVLNEAGDELFSAETTFENVEKDSTVRVNFDDVVLPEDVPTIFTEVGEYRIIYTVVNNSLGGDVYTGDNVNGELFTVTSQTSVYSLGSGTVGIGGSTPIIPTNLYETGTLPDGFVWVAKNLSAGANSDNTDDITCTYDAGIWELDESIDEDLTELGLVPADEDPYLTRVGYGYGALENHPETETFTVASGLLDSETDEEGVNLKPNTQYLVTMAYNDVDYDAYGSFRPHCSTSINYFQDVVFLYSDGQLFTLSNDSWAWKLILESDLGVPTKAQKDLVDATLSVYPNPATDMINLEFELANNEEVVTMAVRDLSGKLITTKNQYNVSNGLVQLNTSDFVAGTYTVSMYVANGNKTAKFTVIK